MVLHVEDPWMKECGAQLTSTLATEWGWKTWEPSMDGTVQQAYSQLCGAVQDEHQEVKRYLKLQGLTSK